MSPFQHGSRASDHFTRLSLEQLEPRSVPSAVTFQVASEIVRSHESFVNTVTAEFTGLLGRTPDTAGLNFFVGQLQNGVTPEVLDAVFVSSQEYIRNHGGIGGGWIPGMFHDLLGRLPSTSELNFFATEFARGASVFQIALSITTSIERDAVVVTNDYVQLLGRAPDFAGFNFFVTAMRNGATRFGVASTIIGSTEYFVDHGINNGGFIVGVFQDVLHRTPNNAELTFFLTQLNTL
jgi:hypothetical protein